MKAKDIKKLTLTAMLMAMNIVLSMEILSIPVPGGHLYANDIVICTAALLLDPFCAFAVGGVGAFLGDLIFYPTPMFVSLVTHGLQAVVISILSRKLFSGKKPVISSLIAVAVGAVIMVAGYSLGRAYIYSTPAYAVAKLPFQILQALLGFLSVPLCYACGIKKAFDRLLSDPNRS